MPPRARFYRSFAFRALIACVAGLLTGGFLTAHPLVFGGWFLLKACRWLMPIVLLTGKCLAIPLLFTSVVTGADGLEPMRGVGRLTVKTAAWIAGSSAVAVLTGWLVAVILRPTQGRLYFAPLEFGHIQAVDRPDGGELWIALVVVALALGVYRNQVEQPGARMLLRFALAIDEALTLLLDWASRVIPLAIFCVAVASASTVTHDLFSHHGRLPGLLRALATGWVIYGFVVLPLALLALARLNPWRYALAIAPAALATLAGTSPVEAFSLTLTRVRVRGGVSNRVSSVALAGCTALLRDGQALGCAVVGTWMIPTYGHGAETGQILAAAWIFGCAAAALAGPGASVVLLSLVAGSLKGTNGDLILTLGLLIGLVGNALSVFSQACAAAVIARSEGETKLLPALPLSPGFADVLLAPPAL